MSLFADLQIHSRFSRATSKDITLPSLENWAKVKGVGLMGTGDFTHPKWIAEIKEQLKDDGSGILRSQSGFPFLLTGEISFIYSQDGRGRKVHLLIFAPSIEVVEQINAAMLRRGRLDYDGRPIFGMSCPEFVELMMGISTDIEIIPAHAWTPWFSLFGSNSGFDNIKDCFQDQLKHIHAIETGLSSDPPMNWRLSQLDNFTLVSNSDSHSYWPWRLGRECTLFDFKELSYSNIIRALRTRQGLAGTLEVDPNYGKYHFDGHRACNINVSPAESIKMKNICPMCKKSLTLGVLHRVEELADRPEGFKPSNALPFISMIPLSEIIAAVIGSPLASKKVWAEFDKIVSAGPELHACLDMPADELKKLTSEKIADAIIACRGGRIKIIPGYDGEYGRPLFTDEPVSTYTYRKTQKDLFDFI